jgi:lipopolysaccharide export system permease protein
MKYYLILLPSVLVRIVPIAVLLAVIYALYQLSKNSELIAMKACGFSLPRLMLPFLWLGLAISLSVLGVNEYYGPSAAYWCHKFVREQKSSSDAIHYATIAFKKEKQARFWFIDRFDTRDFSLDRVEVIQMSPDGQHELSKTRADGGGWFDGQWIFTNVTTQAYDEDGNLRGAPEYAAQRVMLDYNERPEDFVNEVKDPEFLSSADLDRFIRVHRNLEPKSVARLQTDLHARLAMPWASLIVVLMGVPVGAHGGRRGVLPAVAAALGMIVSYYAIMMFGMAASKAMVIPPWLGGWLPIMLFTVTGLATLRAIR